MSEEFNVKCEIATSCNKKPQLCGCLSECDEYKIEENNENRFEKELEVLAHKEKMFRKEHFKYQTIEDMFEELSEKNVKIKVCKNKEGVCYFMQNEENGKLYLISMKMISQEIK